MIGRLAHELKRNFEIEKARLQGRAISRAVLLKQAVDIPEVAKKLDRGPARSTGAVVRMPDGRPMVFFSDGSLRHALGRKTTKAARKALKKERRRRARLA